MTHPSPVDQLRGSNAAQAVAVRSTELVDYIKSGATQDMIRRVAGDTLSPERVTSLVISSIKKTPLLARCTPKSVLGSLLTSVSLGVEPNTVAQQAFLIPYKTRARIDGKWQDIYECQFQIGNRGFITLAYRSKFVKSLKAEAVRLADIFDYEEGTSGFLKYKKDLKESRETPIFAGFCFTRLVDDFDAFTVLPLHEIHKIRNKSQTFRFLYDALEQAKASGNQKDIATAQRKFDGTPWVEWEGEMVAKTLIKRHLKQLPVFEQLRLLTTAAAIDDGADAGIIDMASFASVDAVQDVVRGGAPPEYRDPYAGMPDDDYGEGEEETSDAPPPPKTAKPAAVTHEQTVQVDLGLDKTVPEKEPVQVEAQRTAPPPPRTSKAPPAQQPVRTAPPPRQAEPNPPADEADYGGGFGSME
jgi:phage RecT family recombinase